MADAARRDLTNGFELTTRHGRMVLFESAPQVFDIAYEGLGLADFARAGIAHMSVALRQPDARISLIVDASRLRSYESEYRRSLTRWMRENRDRIDLVLMLYESKLVEMGINMVNPLVGNIMVPFSRREPFDRTAAEIRRVRNGWGHERLI